MHNATKNTPDPATNPDASTRGLYEGIFSILLAALGVTVEDLVHDYNAVNWDERLVDPRRDLCDVSPALLLLPSSAQSARVCACRPGFGSDVGPAPCGRSRAVRARCAAA